MGRVYHRGVVFNLGDYRMKMAASVLAATAISLVASGSASGQVIGKVPPAAPATPAYTPPPAPTPGQPAPGQAKPAEPEKPLPNLVVRDAAGKLRTYPQGVERAAVEAFEFDAATKDKVAASEKARNADIERMVVEKFDKMLEVRKARANLDQMKDLAEFNQLKDIAAPVKSEKLTDRLMRDGALSAMQRNRIDQVVKQYEDALKAEWQQQTGTDIMKIATLVGRVKFEEVTADAFAAEDRLLTRAAESLGQAEGDLKLIAPQKPGFDAAVVNAAKGAAGRQMYEDWFYKDLTLEQQKALLGRVLGPAPEKK